MGCIFCDIIAGKIPADIVYQDDDVLAFRDISPQAPTHILIIPKRHIASLAELTEADSPLIGHMVATANKLAQDEGIADNGYRVAVNCGEWGGQVVLHLHMHLLGGRRLAGNLG